jgi:hypothetical protein
MAASPQLADIPQESWRGGFGPHMQTHAVQQNRGPPHFLWNHRRDRLPRSREDSRMRRREFIGGLGAAASSPLWPPVSRRSSGCCRSSDLLEPARPARRLPWSDKPYAHNVGATRDVAGSIVSQLQVPWLLIRAAPRLGPLKVNGSFLRWSRHAGDVRGLGEPRGARFALRAH